MKLFKLSEKGDWRRYSVEAHRKSTVRLAYWAFRALGYRLIATGSNIDARYVWTFDKGKCPYLQD